MNCADAKSRMQPYTAGILSPSEREEFEAHVGACPGCSLELDLLRAGVTGTAGPRESAEPVAAPVITTDTSGTGEEEAVSPSFVRSGDAGFRPEAADSTMAEEVSFADLFTELQSAKAPAVDAAGYPPSIPAAAPPQVPQPPVRSTPVHPAAPITAARKDWSFEPADAGTRTAPPAGSLFLAEESLSEAGQAAGARRRALPLRPVLWIAGGGVGMALLGLASWMIWTSRPEIEDPARLAAQRYTTATSWTDAGSRAAVPTPGTAAPAAPGAGMSAPTPVPVPPPQEPAAAPPASTEPPATLAGLAASSTAGETPALSGSTTTSATSPTRERKPAKTPGIAAPAGSSRTAARHAAEGSPMAVSGATAPAARPTEAPPVASPEVHAESSTSKPRHAASAESVPPAVQPNRESAPEPAPSPAATVPAPAAAAPSPAAAVPETAGQSTTPVGAATPGASAPAAPEEPAMRPIDRIHLATVAAEERGDLQALRTLRATWRTMVQRSGVGQDRTRAKRELADCLWAIQSITARRSDRRDALAAYRDYVLNAPAGGADSRSIKRVQLLQDALSESH